MYRGILTKISNNINALRTPSVEGEFAFLPEVGQSFTIYSKPLTEADYREVTTSIIVKLSMKEGIFYFSTLNSEYSLECLT